MNNLRFSEAKFRSQNGEDGILQEMINRINFDHFEKGHIFEFGAGDGGQNNSLNLIQRHGWAATLIESDESSFNSLAEQLKWNSKVKCISAKVTPENIQELIDSTGKEIDILSIDIDGQDYWVWKAVQSKPKIVVIEYNAHIDGKKAIVEGRTKPWDGSTAYGASIDAYVELGKLKGYTFVHADSSAVNAFFIRDDLAHLFPEKDNPHVITGINRHWPTKEDVFVEV